MPSAKAELVNFGIAALMVICSVAVTGLLTSVYGLVTLIVTPNGPSKVTAAEVGVPTMLLPTSANPAGNCDVVSVMGVVPEVPMSYSNGWPTVPTAVRLLLVMPAGVGEI